MSKDVTIYAPIYLTQTTSAPHTQPYVVGLSGTTQSQATMTETYVTDGRGNVLRMVVVRAPRTGGSA
jgi:hypothetical protein